MILGRMAALGAAMIFAPASTLAQVADSTDTAAPSPPPADTSATADSLDALADYLDGLSRRTDDEFLLESLSISDAEVDSLLRTYEANGETPEFGPEPRWRFDPELGGVRFNRVEGLNVMPSLTITPPLPRGHLELFGRAGYGWSSEEATWRGGLRAGLPLSGRPTLEVVHARDVYSYGAGGAPGNSMLALTVGEDYDDYFLAEGFSASLGWSPASFAGVSLSFTAEDQESIATATDFTLFDEGDRFRVNPAIQEGAMRRLDATVSVGNAAQGAWAGKVRGAVAGNSLGGDFDYESVEANVTSRRRLPWFGDELKTKIGGGLVRGDAPYQALHFLGGTRRLRGYDINEFAAREFAHASFEYKLGTDLLQYVPWVRRLRLQPVPFFDAAALFEAQTPDGTPVPLDDPEYRFATGIGVQYNVLGIPGGPGQARLDVARRLDRGDDAWTYRFGFTIER